MLGWANNKTEHCITNRMVKTKQVKHKISRLLLHSKYGSSQNSYVNYSTVIYLHFI